MARTTSESQEAMYEERADEYDALIAAEDTDGTLQRTLLRGVDLGGKVVADIGAGTGRLARWVAPIAKHIHLIDRAKPMLEVARRHLSNEGHTNFTIVAADARELPLEDDSVDLAMAGWVFGHFRHWMPEGWKDEVDSAIAEMQRIVSPGGPLVIIETLGTGHEVPRKHEGLDEYFEHLESKGFKRQWVRTDYSFESVDAACETMGAFFGDALVEKIRENEWSRVPECTAIFVLD